jgi:hypothetical protein
VAFAVCDCWYIAVDTLRYSRLTLLLLLSHVDMLHGFRG